MNLEDWEFVSGDNIYEVYGDTISINGQDQPIRYLGSVPDSRFQDILPDARQRGFGLYRGGWLLVDPIDFGELSREIKPGYRIVGRMTRKLRASSSEYDFWVSGKIDRLQ